MKEFLQKYIKQYPDRSYIVNDNGEPNWNALGIDTSKVDVSKIDIEQLRVIIEDNFIYEDYFG